MLRTGLYTTLRRLFALQPLRSKARYGLTAATQSDSVVCKVSSDLSPLTYAITYTAPFTSTPAHFSSSVSVAA